MLQFFLFSALELICCSHLGHNQDHPGGLLVLVIDKELSAIISFSLSDMKITQVHNIMFFIFKISMQ